MDRRHFIGMAAVGSTVGFIAPKNVLAGSGSLIGAGGLFYTKDAPGRWSKKIASHLPGIEVLKGDSGTKIKVITAHEMSVEHYIVKHIVLDQNFQFVAENMFDPLKVTGAISEFDISSLKGTVNVLSVCNKHDTWLNSIVM